MLSWTRSEGHYHCQYYLSSGVLERQLRLANASAVGSPTLPASLSAPPQLSDRVILGQASKLSLAFPTSTVPGGMMVLLPNGGAPSETLERASDQGPLQVGPWPEMGWMEACGSAWLLGSRFKCGTI